MKKRGSVQSIYCLVTGIIICLLLSLQDISSADLIRGARPLGMAGACNGVQGDVNTLFNNMAGMSTVSRNMLILSSMPVYGVDQLYYFRMGYIFPYLKQKIGVGWNRFFLSDFYIENEFVAAAAYDFKKYLSAGIRPKIVSLSLEKPESETGFNNRSLYFTFDIGFNIQIMKYAYFSILGNNLTDPDRSFADESSSLQSCRTLITGFKFNFTDYFYLTFDQEFTKGRDMLLKGGSELWFYDTVAVRAGLTKNEMFGFGAGLKTGYLIFDFGLLAHPVLGNQYQADLTFCY